MFLDSIFSDSFRASFNKGFLDTLFPLYCLGCETKGAWICVLCENKIPRRREQHCFLCLKNITPCGQMCFPCKDSFKSSVTPKLDGIFAASYYKYSLVSRAIHAYKYRFLATLSLPLGSLLADALRQSTLPLPDIILPVPLHKRRLRFRGFNQSELLAEIVSQTLVPGLEITLLRNCLLRPRYTKPQMKTHSRDERLANLRGAFALATGSEKFIRDKNIWIIDDVATTGTTLEECALLLKKHGAHNVFGIVLAR